MEKREAKKIVEIIKEKKIKPENHFNLFWKSYLFWFVWFLMLVFGALFVSLIIFNFMDFHPSFLRYLGFFPFVHWMILTAPLFWILLSLGALVFGLLAFRKTRRGYRHSLLFVTSLTVLFVSVLGTAFHFSKINDRLQNGRFLKSPEMRNMVFPIEGRWQRPDKGFLAGKIGEMNKNNFNLEDMRGREWKVFYSDDTKILRMRRIDEGSEVGVIGKRKNGFVFQAEIIGPFPRRCLDFEERRMMR